MTLVLMALFIATFSGAQEDPKQVNVVDLREQIGTGNYAIVVGINDYSDPEIQDLNYCEEDARRFADSLVNFGGYPREHVIVYTGTDASYATVYTSLANLARAKVPPESTILFYFSGHGFAHQGSNYLIFQDGTIVPDLLDRNMKLEKIEYLLADSAFDRQLLFIDACRNNVSAGTRSVGVKGFVDSITKNAKGMKVFLGTGFGEVSRESEDLESGIFTHYLVRAVSGAGDQNQDGIITFGELELYVTTKMEERNIGRRFTQRPVSRGEGSTLIPVSVLPEGVYETVEDTPLDTDDPPHIPALGRLAVSAIPDGAKVFIESNDQSVIAAGFAPHEISGVFDSESLFPGTYTLTISFEGYETATEIVTIEKDRLSEVSFELQLIEPPTPAPLPVLDESEPEEIDGGVELTPADSEPETNASGVELVLEEPGTEEIAGEVEEVTADVEPQDSKRIERVGVFKFEAIGGRKSDEEHFITYFLDHISKAFPDVEFVLLDIAPEDRVKIDRDEALRLGAEYEVDAVLSGAFEISVAGGVFPTVTNRVPMGKVWVRCKVIDVASGKTLGISEVDWDKNRIYTSSVRTQRNLEKKLSRDGVNDLIEILLSEGYFGTEEE